MATAFIPLLILTATIEVLSMILVTFLRPHEDNSILMAGITLALGQVAQFIVSQANSAANTTKISEQGQQMAQVVTKTEAVTAQAKESIETSRASLTTLIKSDDLLELDRLADAFTKGTLTFVETKRFLALLHQRKKDNLTIAQTTAVLRTIEILEQEVKDPNIFAKQHVPVSAQETADSKEQQAVQEETQKISGERK